MSADLQNLLSQIAVRAEHHDGQDYNNLRTIEQWVTDLMIRAKQAEWMTDLGRREELLVDVAALAVAAVLSQRQRERERQEWKERTR